MLLLVLVMLLPVRLLLLSALTEVLVRSMVL